MPDAECHFLPVRSAKCDPNQGIAAQLDGQQMIRGGSDVTHRA